MSFIKKEFVSVNSKFLGFVYSYITMGITIIICFGEKRENYKIGDNGNNKIGITKLQLH